MVDATVLGALLLLPLYVNGLCCFPTLLWCCASLQSHLCCYTNESIGGCTSEFDVSAHAFCINGLVGRLRHGGQGSQHSVQARVRRFPVLGWILFLCVHCWATSQQCDRFEFGGFELFSAAIVMAMEVVSCTSIGGSAWNHMPSHTEFLVLKHCVFTVVCGPRFFLGCRTGDGLKQLTC